jgi:hypothetical protein
MFKHGPQTLAAHHAAHAAVTKDRLTECAKHATFLNAFDEIKRILHQKAEKRSSVRHHLPSILCRLKRKHDAMTKMKGVFP